MKVSMKLKQINQQLKETANSLPLDLCDLNPEAFIDLPKLELQKNIISFQKGIIKSANLVETLHNTINLYAEELQNLRDENNHLKGEQGKPNIRSQSTRIDKDDNNHKTNNSDISSEEVRTIPTNPKPRRTNKEIIIHNTKIVKIDPSTLPLDAIFKGYKNYTVQNIKFEANNTLYTREEYYSASENKSYIATLPTNLEGSNFGYDQRL